MRIAHAIAAVSLVALPALAVAASDTGTAPAERAGEAQFRERCGGCHLADGFGTRVLERRVPDGQAELERRAGLTSQYITLAVRRGIGSMPAIREAELPDEELTEIAAYLGANK